MVRVLELRDVGAVLAIQSASPELPRWTQRDYERVAKDEMAGWVDEDRGAVLGFVVARRLADEMEILNLAVAPEARRRQVGSALLAASFGWGRASAIRKAFLEVRASNFAAIAFYEHHKFRSIGRRQKYYVAPVEDAIILAADL
ncbi:MAG: ribosomal protein S18-alanine N-acetyltransferase [Candidatus Acidiferrales bacterium]|jgi:ribosomal-protein-alanine N-acetyltransferase